MCPKWSRSLLPIAVILSAACASDSTESPNPTDDGRGTSTDPASRSPQLLKKSGEVLSRDLAQGLELPREEVCRELGLYDCSTGPHRIVLGGVEPYVLGVDEPLRGVPVTAPIALDRVALSACGRRARLDFEAADEARVFGDLAQGLATGREAAVEALYTRLLGRTPDREEAALLLELAAPPSTEEDFAILSCFVVATTLEFLFY